MNQILEDYLKSLLPEKENWMVEMEEYAQLNQIPIMDPVSMQFVIQLIEMFQPNKILEIGTAIGYSALRMHKGAPNSKITTVEKDKTRFEQASDYIGLQDKKDEINIINGDALEVLSYLPKNTYDLIFIDAAKGQYERFFNLSSPLLTNKGLVISDNVLFRGFISGEKNVPKRYKKLTDKIQSYNRWLTGHQEYSTSIIPIGDGIAISHKNVS